MIKYLLIDTCILERLVANDDYSIHLKWLKKMLDKKEFILLAPDALIEEWKNHREGQIKKVRKAVAAQFENISGKFFEDAESGSKPDKTLAERVLVSQVEDIDQLLKEAVPIAASEKVKSIIIDQLQNRFFPFFNKKDSISDALIIFSALEFVNNQGPDSSLYFISSNKDDFELVLAGRSYLHTDITSNFPSVKVEYFKVFNDFRRQFNLAELPGESGAPFLSDQIKIDTEKPVLDQLHEYFTKRFWELKFLPLKLFAFHQPIIINNKKPYYSPPFALVTDNKAVYDIFTGDENDTDPKKKFISQILFDNFVFNISINPNEQTAIKAIPTPSSEIRECYETLNFKKLVEQIQLPTNDPFEKAYYYYKLGMFIQSAQLFEETIETVKDNYPTKCFIAWFNLHRLRVFIDNNFWEQQKDEALLEKLMAIDLEDKARINYDQENRQIIQYINKREFLNETLASMQDNLSSIRDDYYGQTGGTQTHYHHLLSSFAQFDNFLTTNCLVYDYFSEFVGVMDVFTEGLMASHACHPSLGNRLEHFDDYHACMLLLHSTDSSIKKFAGRYKLKKLAYKPSGPAGHTFLDLTSNILSGSTAVLENYKTIPGSSPRFLEDRLERMILNAIMLGALLELTSDQAQQLSENLLSFSNSQDIVHPVRLSQAIQYFLYKKHELLNDDILRKFVLLGVNNPGFHTADYVLDFNIMAVPRKIDMHFSEQDKACILEYFAGKCPRCNKEHSMDVIGTIFQLERLDAFKQKITDSVSAFIGNSEFKPENYANAAIFDVVAPTEALNQKYIEQIALLASKGRGPRMWPRTDFYTDYRIDMFLNMWFKYGYTIPENVLHSIQSLDPYYKWLTDPDGFDYAGFSSDWPHHHWTKFCKWHLRKSMVLKNHLLELVKKTRDEKLSQYIVFTFMMDD